LGHSVIAALPPEIIVPDQNPKTTEYTTKAAVLLASFMQQMIRPVAIPPIPKALSRQNLSARILGMMRPNVEAPLRIATKYEASVASMPRATACVGMKNDRGEHPENYK
jgi:hypothetical protein